VTEHSSHRCYACDVPLANVNVEQISIIEHGIHICYPWDVPPGNVNVEHFGFIEHHPHRCYTWNVPSRNIPIKRSCNLEHCIHWRYTRDIPRIKVFIKCATVERSIHWCDEGHIPFLDRPVTIIFWNGISSVCGPILNGLRQRIIRFQGFRCGLGHQTRQTTRNIGRFWGRNSHCGCRWSGWRWTSYFSSTVWANTVPFEYFIFVSIPAQLLVEWSSVTEHSIHTCYACDVPLTNVNVEQISIIEHGIHTSYAWDVPPGNVNVEHFGFIEHHPHICYPRDVPSRNIPIKRTCNLEH